MKSEENWSLPEKYVSAFAVDAEDGRTQFDQRSQTLRILARSPGSRAVQAVLKHLEIIASHGVRVEAVFLKVPNQGPGSAVLSRFAKVYGVSAVSDCVRLLDEPDFKRAYEMIIFGDSAVWTGERLSHWRGAKPDDGFVQPRNDERSGGGAAHYVFEQYWQAAGDKQLTPQAARPQLT
jgi:hypothetical protein